MTSCVSLDHRIVLDAERLDTRGRVDRLFSACESCRPASRSAARRTQSESGDRLNERPGVGQVAMQVPTVADNLRAERAVSLAVPTGRVCAVADQQGREAAYSHGLAVDGR